MVHHMTKARFCMKELLEMAKERASSGAKLSAVTIVGSREFAPGFSDSGSMSRGSSTGWTMLCLNGEPFQLTTDDTSYENDW